MGGRVERKSELPEVRDRDRGLQPIRQERERLARGRAVGIDERSLGPGHDEQAGERRGDAAEREPRRGLRCVEVVQRGSRLGCRLRPEARAVDEHEPGEVTSTRMPAEVPRRVGRDDRPAERVTAEHDLAAEPARGRDHAVEVLHGDVHAPPLGEAERRGVRDDHVLRDRRVRQIPEVVVEQRASRRPCPAWRG